MYNFSKNINDLVFNIFYADPDKKSICLGVEK